MNQKRRVLSFILALTMIFQTGMSTFAAEDTTKATVEVTTEASGEAVTEVVTEGTTEAATEGTTEAATEGTTEAATEAVTEVTTELPTEDLTQADTAESTEAEATTSESTLTKAGQLNPISDPYPEEVELVDYALLKSDGNCYVTNAAGTKTDGEVLTSNLGICHLFVADDVTEIGTGKFDECAKLKDITFSKQSSLTTIGQSAFWRSGLREISLPDSVTTIAFGAFAYSEDLESIEISNQSKLASIGEEAFSRTPIKTIGIPDATTSIGNRAFYRCTKLESVSFSEQSKLETIGEYAFSETNLKEIKIPGSVTAIKDCAFEGCCNLTNISFTDGSKLKSLGQMVFQHAAIEKIEIPASVTSMGYYCCGNCAELNIIKFLSKTPPTIEASFITDSSFAKIWVPYGTADSYIEALKINNSRIATTGYVKEYRSEVIFDRGVKTFQGKKQTDSFTYGDTITVQIAPVKTGNSTICEIGSTTKTMPERVALYAGGAKITEFKEASIGSEVSIDVDTKNKNLTIGKNVITAVFSGSDELAGYSEDVTVTLAKKEITAAEVKPDQKKTYDGYTGFRDVSLSLTGVEEGDVVTASADGTARDALAGSNKKFSASSVTLGGLHGIYYSLKPTLVKGTVDIVKAEPTATMSVSLSGTGSKKTATLTAVVEGVSGAKTPSGTVAFMTSDGVGTREPIKGAEKVRLTNGKAVYKWKNISELNKKLIAVYSGDNNYNPVESRETVIDTSKKEQKDFSLTKIGTKTYGDSVTLSTSGGEGSGAVAFTSSDPTVIEINGTTAKILKSGKTVITAVKAGDSDYNEAATQETVTVSKKTIVAKPENISITVSTEVPAFTWSIKTGIDGETVTATNSDAVKMQAQKNGVVMERAMAGTYDIVFTTEPVFEASDKFQIVLETGTMVIEKKELTESGLKQKAAELDHMILITNVSSSIDSLKFTVNGTEQSGWSFLKDASGKSIQATPYESQMEQSFKAVYEDATYAPAEIEIPVTVTKIDGVTMFIDSQAIKKGEGSSITLVPDIMGLPLVSQAENVEQYNKLLKEAFQDNSELSDIYQRILNKATYELSSKRGNGIKKEGTRFFTLSADIIGKDTLTASVTMKGMTPKKGVTQFQELNNIEIVDTDLIDEIVLTPIAQAQVTNGIAYSADADNNVSVDLSNVTKTSNSLEVTVGKSATDSLSKKEYTVTSSDRNVAVVKALDEKIQITVKSAGATTITVQAKDKKKASTSFVLTCKDYTPVLMNQTVTMNKYKETVEELDLHAAYDNTISAITIYEKGEEQESSNFQVTIDEGYIDLALKTDAPLKETKRAVTKKCELRIVTTKGLFIQPLTIKYEVKKPTAQAKCDNQAYLLLENPTAYFTLKSAEDVKTVTFTPSQTVEGITFQTHYYDSSQDGLQIEIQGLTPENIEAFEKNRSPQRTGVLRIQYEDYSEDADTLIKMEVPIDKSIPAVVSYPSVSYIYPGEANQTTSFIVENKRWKGYSYNIDEITPLTEGVTAEKDGEQNVKVTYTGNKDRIVAEFLVTPVGWTKAVKVKHEIRRMKTPELELYQDKITLNTGATEPNTIQAWVKKNNEMKIASIEVVNSVKTKTGLNLIESGLLSVSYSAAGGLSLKASEKAPAGTYDLLLDATTDSGLSCKQSKLKVTITDKTPIVKVSASGKLDAIDDLSYITYIFSPQNMEGTIKNIEMSGGQEEKFDIDIVSDGGKIDLHIMDDAVVSTKEKYSIAFKITFENGMTVTTAPQTIKIGQKKPTYKANISQATMIQKSTNTVEYYVKGTGNYDYFCMTHGVKLVSYTDYFTYDSESRVLSFNEENKNKLKRGTYRLEFEVPFTGEAVDGPVYKSYLSVYVK